MVGVYNYDNHGHVNSYPNISIAILCADIQNFTSYSELAVRPCELPPASAGPYWILYYNESQGLGLVSGGPPTEIARDGLCKTGEGEDNSGLWIFTREQVCACVRVFVRVSLFVFEVFEGGRGYV